MSTIVYQIVLALNLLSGGFGTNTQAQAQAIYDSGSYTVVSGVIIIDTDEL